MQCNNPMNWLNIQRQADRRDEILNAAQRCFVRSGFHQTSMQEICAEAGMSAGNLYRYFPSKEAIIAGIAERDRAEVAQDFASADLSQGLFAVLEGMAHHHFTIRSIEQVKLCTEVMSEARRNPEIARISAAFDADVRKWLIDHVQRRRRTRRHRQRCRHRGRGRHADDHRRRRVVAARARSELSSRRPAADVHGCHAAPAAGPRASSRVGRGDSVMKASRIVAVGLVAAAGLWIASGHLIPHESAESRAAFRAGEAGPRSASASPSSTPRSVSHSRKLVLSGRTEADRKVVTFARTGGVLQELRVRRGSRVKKGDVIAVLSDDAREAQVLQAKALLDQRTHRARGQAAS